MLSTMHTGQITRGIKPSWEPLSGLVGKNVVPGFMWMFALKFDDGAEVHAYKSVTTRQFVHLAADGRAFAHVDQDRYEEVTPRQALEHVFDGWEDASPQPRNADAVRALLAHHQAAAVERTA
jgi:hypothetical protein